MYRARKGHASIPAETLHQQKFLPLFVSYLSDVKQCRRTRLVHRAIVVAFWEAKKSWSLNSPLVVRAARILLRSYSNIPITEIDICSGTNCVRN